MLNNKLTLDILTPMSDFHRVSRKVLNRDAFSVKAGFWAKKVNGGVMSFNEAATAATSGVNVLCLSDYIPASNPLSMYEGNDTKVGNITAVNAPGIRVLIGEAYLVTPTAWDNSVYNTGVALKVVSHLTVDTGKLTVAATGDYANAVIQDVDNVAKTVEIMILPGKV